MVDYTAIKTKLYNMIDWQSLTINVVIGYSISWIYFLLTVNYFQNIFGKINGAFINYSISWVLWIILTYTMHKISPIIDHYNYFSK
jgi:hypothetical protein